ncbi:MAG: 5-formyltetrahydrofolate cyclo-ligase [Hyphomonadaceae bacterium]|nr:5-formyltetrahydrofolate cyclo-ligase [Hyphomonadaceae bacterium]
MISSADIDGEKAALRKVLIARRAGASKDRLAAAQALSRHFRLAFPAIAHGAVVAFYMPMRDEMDPRALIADLAAGRDDLVFALPRTPPKGAGLPLSFHIAPPEADLVKSAFGVLEPAPDTPVVTPDIVLAPLLGFDRRAFRLGYGAGHYDRTLAALRARHPVRAVGLAWACQEVDRIPTDDFDQRLDGVVTEAGFFPSPPRGGEGGREAVG